MRSDYINILGEKFGLLTVIELIGQIAGKQKAIHWICRCDCGNTKIISGTSLRRKSTASCGCLQRKAAKLSKITHGLSKTRLHKIWDSMKTRCTYPSHNSYKNYGGRGIKVCEEWLEFINFHQWAIENGYNDLLTIDRIDNDKDYSPENCKWMDWVSQCRNKRNNKRYLFEGEMLILREISERTGIHTSTLRFRYHKNI